MDFSVDQMKFIRYKTTVKANGQLDIPKSADLAGVEVEVYVIPSQHVSKNKGSLGKQFVADWSGFLPETTQLEERLEFLKHKHQ